jgi:hypothetical protein
MRADGLILVANALELLTGIGVLLALGLAGHGRALVARLGLAYGLGLAITGILAANLALVGVLPGLPELTLLAVVALVAGLLRRRPEARGASAGRDGMVAAAIGVGVVILLATAAWAFAVHPLSEWDGWAIWGMKAKALYDFGGANSPVLTSPLYSQPSYPLLLPALEAVDFRALGSADGTAVHLQLALLAVAYAGSLFGLLWRRVPSSLVALTALAMLAAPWVLAQLAMNYADVPLAFFVALGLVALACWLREDRRELLVVAAVFFAAGVLTKNEGTMFFAAAMASAGSLLLVRARRRLVPLALAAAAVVAVFVPWRIFTAVHHLAIGSVRLSSAGSLSSIVNGSGRGGEAANVLAHQFVPHDWALLVPLLAIGLVAAVSTRRFGIAVFVSAWAVISFGGLVADYWLSPLPLRWYLATSASRVVTTIVVASASMVPLLAADAWRALEVVLLASADRTRRSRITTSPLV